MRIEIETVSTPLPLQNFHVIININKIPCRSQRWIKYQEKNQGSVFMYLSEVVEKKVLINSL